MGKVTVLYGKEIRECVYSEVKIEKMLMKKETEQKSFPLFLTEGELRLISPLWETDGKKDIKLSFRGKNMKLTVLHQNHVIGRVLLESEKFPEVKGGNREVIFLCKEWLQDQTLRILCQAVEKDAYLT